jgi:hypothetical protein
VYLGRRDLSLLVLVLGVDLLTVVVAATGVT